MQCLILQHDDFSPPEEVQTERREQNERTMNGVMLLVTVLLMIASRILSGCWPRTTAKASFTLHVEGKVKKGEIAGTECHVTLIGLVCLITQGRFLGAAPHSSPSKQIGPNLPKCILNARLRARKLAEDRLLTSQDPDKVTYTRTSSLKRQAQNHNFGNSGHDISETKPAINKVHQHDKSDIGIPMKHQTAAVVSCKGKSGTQKVRPGGAPRTTTERPSTATRTPSPAPCNTINAAKVAQENAAAASRRAVSTRAEAPAPSPAPRETRERCDGCGSEAAPAVQRPAALAAELELAADERAPIWEEAGMLDDVLLDPVTLEVVPAHARAQPARERKPASRAGPSGERTRRTRPTLACEGGPRGWPPPQRPSAR
jgi:hypothetical protein